MKSDVIQETQQRVCHPLSLPAPDAVTQIDEYEWSIVYLRNSRASVRENHGPPRAMIIWTYYRGFEFENDTVE